MSFLAKEKRLEAKYSPLNITEAKKTNYIVVLAGADSIHEAYPLTSSLGSAASNRLREAIRLYHRMNQPRIVLFPAPCDYQAGRSYTLLSFFPSGGNLEIPTRAINEYLHLLNHP